jgi:AefR-like transcriptional repressor, C-terminal domain
MQAACRHHGKGTDDKETPPWFSLGPSVAVQLAGETYLRSILAEDQIALFRVMIRDAHKFPELGHRYQQEVTETRNKLFVRYLEQWRKKEGWKLANPERAAIIFAALLRSDIFENALLGLRMPSEQEIVNHAKASSYYSFHAQACAIVNAHALEADECAQSALIAATDHDPRLGISPFKPYTCYSMSRHSEALPAAPAW